MAQSAPGPDSARQAAKKAPTELVRSRIDSALAARIEAGSGYVSPSMGGESSGAVGARASLLSWSGAFLFIALIALWFVRRVRVRVRAARQGAEIGAPAEGDTQRGAGRPAEARHRGAPRPKPIPQPMTLPPHVVAMLQRAQERRLAEAASAARRPEEAQDDEAEEDAPPPGGGLAGVDLWVGE